MSTIKQLLEKNVMTVFSQFPRIPLHFVGKFSKPALILPYYHIVSDEEVLHVKHLFTFRNTKQFRSDLDFFLKNYVPISLSDLLNYLKGKQSIPNGAFHLTFDDGFAEQYSVIAPILKQKGIPATFFLVSNFLDNTQLFYRHKSSVLIEHFQRSATVIPVGEIKAIFLKYGIKFTDCISSTLSVEDSQQKVLDKIAFILNVDFSDYLKRFSPYLTLSQVEQLIKDGFTIGAHSLSHQRYSSLPLEVQLYQTRESMKIIGERFLLNYRAFAFPHDDRGVSKKYFEEIFSNGAIDISFGTSGMIHDVSPYNFQRLKMEGTAEPAERIVARQYMQKFVRIVHGSDKIRRDE